MTPPLTDARLAEIRAKLYYWAGLPDSIVINGEVRDEAPPIIAELLAEVERLRAAERGRASWYIGDEVAT